MSHVLQQRVSLAYSVPISQRYAETVLLCTVYVVSGTCLDDSMEERKISTNLRTTNCLKIQQLFSPSDNIAYQVDAVPIEIKCPSVKEQYLSYDPPPTMSQSAFPAKKKIPRRCTGRDPARGSGQEIF